MSDVELCITKKKTTKNKLTDSGSLCCSKKAENSTSLSLEVPMERPCHAGAVGVGAVLGS